MRCERRSWRNSGLRQMASLTRESRLVDRSKWLEDCFRRTEPSELVFFDPDNGIEVRSVPKHNIKAGKYIYWNELVGFWDRGQALLIYHHLNRTKPAAEQVTELGHIYELSSMAL